MPINPAVSRSCATARSALPRNVNFMNAYSSAIVAVDTRMMMRLWAVKNVPATRKTFWLYGVSNA